MKFRNMLSAHTTNREDAPLWPGNLAKCFRVERVHGGIKGQLHIPHSFETGDNLVLMLSSDLHPDTKAGNKEMRNLVDLRPTKKEMLERMLWKLVLYRPQCHL